jgi:hypothetical protein
MVWPHLWFYVPLHFQSVFILLITCQMRFVNDSFPSSADNVRHVRHNECSVCLCMSVCVCVCVCVCVWEREFRRPLSLKSTSYKKTFQKIKKKDSSLSASMIIFGCRYFNDAEADELITAITLQPVIKKFSTSSLISNQWIFSPHCETNIVQ